MEYQAAVFTIAGKVRQNNEDSAYFAGQSFCDTVMQEPTATTGLAKKATFAVCDGMGGESNGERASRIAVEKLRGYSIDEFKSAVGQAIDEANRQICREIEENGRIRMGSTAVVLCIDQDKAQLCNIGDSRGYLLHSGTLQQLSVDHTEKQQMLDMGAKETVASMHGRQNALTQHLGIFPEEMVLEPYFSQIIELQVGDQFLLCSDGVWNCMEESELLKAFQSGSDMKDSVLALINEAMEHGGKDNITAICVKIMQTEQKEAAHSDGHWWNRLFKHKDD